MIPATLIVDIPQRNVDLTYATKFSAPDAVIFLEQGNRKFLFLSDLELERGKKEAHETTCLALAKVQRALQIRKQPTDTAHVIAAVCRERKIRAVRVPANFPVRLADQLRDLQVKITPIDGPLYPARMIKSPAELRAMRIAQRVTFQAIDFVRTMFTAASVKKNVLQWKGKPLTSEIVRQEATIFLLRKNFACPEEMIIAGGDHGVDPHERGSGVLCANEAIIVDIFPQSLETGFYGDATRTFCKGRATPELTRQYDTVKRAQTWALNNVRGGMDGKIIHHGITEQFEAAGYKTGEKDGVVQGFFHGTGHGLGLVCHEEPLRINRNSWKLAVGNVVTVEPGLYYRGVGGVRIEDVVVLTKTGAELLATYPKTLEV